MALVQAFVPFLCLVALLLQSDGVAAQSQFWNGLQKAVLLPKVSDACDAALNTTINCPANLIQLITYSMQMVGWNETGLGLVCSAECEASFPNFAAAVSANCGSAQDSINFNSQNMSLSELGPFLSYKYDLLCRRDSATQDLCLFVEDAWNIAELDAQGSATWPQHTEKCYFDPASGAWEYMVDENGTCIDIFEDTEPYVTDISGSGPFASLAYWSTQFTGAKSGTGTNWGWPTPLAFDEYPLEIQCSSCFLSRLQVGYGSRFGPAWDEITEQTWQNIKMNCGLTSTIAPANNLTGKGFESFQKYLAESQTPRDLSSCPQTIEVTGSAQYSCNTFALEYSVSTAAIRTFNPGMCGSYNSLFNTTVCAPDACRVAVVPEQTNLRGLLISYTNFTATQFRNWNWYINSEVIRAGDTVCVGPLDGLYIPSVAPVPSPTIYTTTAIPASPTDPATIHNCGFYYPWQSNDTCTEVCLRFQISFSQLINMNPEIDTTCSNVVVGHSYCIAPVNGTTVTPVTTTTLGPSLTTHISSSTSHTSGSSTTTKAPVQTGVTPSPDGTCGPGSSGAYTCLGSKYDGCCSVFGYCGGDSNFCGAGCQPGFGNCGIPSVDGRCGNQPDGLYTLGVTLISAVRAAKLVTETVGFLQLMELVAARPMASIVAWAPSMAAVVLYLVTVVETMASVEWVASMASGHVASSIRYRLMVPVGVPALASIHATVRCLANAAPNSAIVARVGTTAERIVSQPSVYAHE
ncbi:hypothetical protein GQ53DRAFT_815696 [Thozetella sp. PMI_491]|nr:hypothetical protein GQ53DRAFT_815696 [Thozetella sp. PMI_491]